jgi:signal transduction histidine kinase
MFRNRGADTAIQSGVTASMKQAIRTTFSKDIPSKKAEVKRIIYEAMNFYSHLKSSGMALPVDEFYFRLALDELLENALSHGNRHDESKRIGVSIDVAAEGIDISVRDDGPGFRPETIKDPTDPNSLFNASGRGLHLLRNIGDVTWNDSGNEIKIRVR